MTRKTQLDIANVAAAAARSPEHKRFQALLGKITKARERLAAWHEQLPVFAQMHADAAAPLLAKLTESRRAWAFELEGLLERQRWAKADAGTLSAMVVHIAGALLDTSDASDAELKALYNRHADVDYDSLEQQQLGAMKDMLEEMTGLELGEEPVDELEDLMRRAQAQMAADQAQRQPRKPGRKTAAQKRAEEDERRVSQTVREVYRKLASALHPDRVEADMPKAEHDRRTALMQRANAAYESGDLLALLELQLQIEQVDIAHAAGVAAEQVRHFNKVLAEQLREIEREIDERQRMFCGTYGLMTEQRIDPSKLGALLKDELRELAAAQALVDHDRRMLRGDPAMAKRFLKQWRAEQRAARFDDFFF